MNDLDFVQDEFNEFLSFNYKSKLSEYETFEFATDRFEAKPEILIKREKIEKYNKAKQIELKESIIKNLCDRLTNIQKNFEDITYRQVCWVEFKNNVNSLWDVVEEENFRNIVILLIDSVRNLKSEKMQKNQIKGFRKIFNILSMDNKFEINLDDVIDIFIKYDIPVLNFPSGSAELVE